MSIYTSSSHTALHCNRLATSSSSLNFKKTNQLVENEDYPRPCIRYEHRNSILIIYLIILTLELNDRKRCMNISLLIAALPTMKQFDNDISRRINYVFYFFFFSSPRRWQRQRQRMQQTSAMITRRRSNFQISISERRIATNGSAPSSSSSSSSDDDGGGFLQCQQ